MIIFCCACQKDIEARLTDGREIYPHRADLYSLPFWKCDNCKNFVGCHHKTKNRTRPLGNIPTKELRTARKFIHAVIDPLWKSDIRFSRGFVYETISELLGYKYHTAEIKSIEEARRVFSIAQKELLSTLEQKLRKRI